MERTVINGVTYIKFNDGTVRLSGASAVTKPIDVSIPPGSVFFETDTGLTYQFNGGSYVPGDVTSLSAIRAVSNPISTKIGNGRRSVIVSPPAGIYWCTVDLDTYVTQVPNASAATPDYGVNTSAAVGTGATINTPTNDGLSLWTTDWTVTAWVQAPLAYNATPNKVLYIGAPGSGAYITCQAQASKSTMSANGGQNLQLSFGNCMDSTHTEVSATLIAANAFPPFANVMKSASAQSYRDEPLFLMWGMDRTNKTAYVGCNGVVKSLAIADLTAGSLTPGANPGLRWNVFAGTVPFTNFLDIKVYTGTSTNRSSALMSVSEFQARHQYGFGYQTLQNDATANGSINQIDSLDYNLTWWLNFRNQNKTGATYWNNPLYPENVPGYPASSLLWNTGGNTAEQRGGVVIPSITNAKKVVAGDQGVLLNLDGTDLAYFTPSSGTGFMTLVKVA